jgi:hypothetical protein
VDVGISLDRRDRAVTIHSANEARVALAVAVIDDKHAARFRLLNDQIWVSMEERKRRGRLPELVTDSQLSGCLVDTPRHEGRAPRVARVCVAKGEVSLDLGTVIVAPNFTYMKLRLGNYKDLLG